MTPSLRQSAADRLGLLGCSCFVCCLFTAFDANLFQRLLYLKVGTLIMILNLKPKRKAAVIKLRPRMELHMSAAMNLTYCSIRRVARTVASNKRAKRHGLLENVIFDCYIFV